jgi:hypothetical protein
VDVTSSTEAPQSPTSSRAAQRKAKPSKARFWVRRIVLLLLAAFAVVGVWFAVTFVPYIRDSQGEPTSVLLATWGRDHGLGSVVAAAEDFYYSHFDVTPVGGKPTESANFGGDPSAAPSASTSTGPTPSSSPTPTRAHLNPPATLVSPVKDGALPDEGVWQPVASKVDGIHAIYATRVRPDAIHTSVLASLMWIDTKLTKTMYVPGYLEPGGPNPYDGALPQKFWPDVLANTNGAFRIQDSQGGYIYKGKTIVPMVDGQATLAIDSAGHMTVGKWGRDIDPNSDIVVARQNLALIIDHGQSRVRDGDGFRWGATTHGESAAWRSAIGERADGSLVYIGSPGLTAQAMADTLISAGVKRAMVLDMNNWWVAGFYFKHDASGAPLCHKLDPNIQEGCDRFLNRYKRDSLQFLAN